MTITMDDLQVTSIPQIREILNLPEAVQFKEHSQKEKYDWIDQVLTRFNYLRLKKKERGSVRKYIMRMSGISKSQLTRLILKKDEVGKILPSSRKRNTFPTTYTPEDIARLVATDNAHERLSGLATKEIFIREYEKFGKADYKRLRKISIAHIYNLREVSPIHLRLSDLLQNQSHSCFHRGKKETPAERKTRVYTRR